jgi:hypothetical protein
MHSDRIAYYVMLKAVIQDDGKRNNHRPIDAVGIHVAQ